MDPVGLIVVDKAGGMTSHDVVSRVRRIAHTRRVGHGGTLDPMATGVLILGVGRATKLLTYVIGSNKRYAGTIRLGQSTVTDDAEGDVVATAPTDGVDDDAIRRALRAFGGFCCAHAASGIPGAAIVQAACAYGSIESRIVSIERRMSRDTCICDTPTARAISRCVRPS